MRKFSIILAFVLLISGLSVYATESYAVTDTYQSKTETVQGVNGWYFCAFPNGTREDMEYYSSNSRWKRPGGIEAYPLIKSPDMLPGNEVDCGFVFVAPKAGIIRLEGKVEILEKANVTARIFKKNGKELLWDEALKAPSLCGTYNTLTRVSEGEEIWFTVDSNGSNSNDFVTWWPKVEYMDMAYVPVSEVDKEYNYKTDFPSADEQGKDGWHAQYNMGTNYSEFNDMLWDGALSGYAVNGISGRTAYMTCETMCSGSGTACAAVWVSPFAGIARLSSDGNIISNGRDISMKIAKTDKTKKNGEVLWSSVADAGDESGINYSIDVPVAAGDRLYFVSEGGGELIWNPSISYIQTTLFANSGKLLTDMLFVNDGDVVDCIFEDGDTIYRDTVFFLAVYDSNNCLRRLTEATNIAAEEWNPRELGMSVNMNFGEESYEGWRISLLALTGECGRYFSTNNSASAYID